MSTDADSILFLEQMQFSSRRIIEYAKARGWDLTAAIEEEKLASTSDMLSRIRERMEEASE